VALAPAMIELPSSTTFAPDSSSSSSFPISGLTHNIVSWAEVDEGEVDLGSGVTEREWEGDGDVNEEVDWIHRQ
jgi:hypothetical protein